MEAKSFCFLEIIGVGYKASTNPQGSISYSKLGFSHEIRIQVAPSVRVFCLKPNLICCTGIDHQKVTQFAASVKSCKPPEVYKGKGIQYRNEILHKKQGKKKQITPHILGANLVSHEQVRIASTQIFGIGPQKAIEVCDQLGPSGNIKVNKSTNYQFDQIIKIMSQNHLVDSESKKSIRTEIKRLISISCYRGFRHNAGLPLRGQRTHTNAKTCRKLRRVSIEKLKKRG